MKLAEALVARADAQRRLAQLQERLHRVVLVQEGVEPGEDPQELLEEAERVIDQLEGLIRRINATNSATAFDEQRTLTDAIAAREAAQRRAALYTRLALEATPEARYRATEIRNVATVDVRELRARADQAAKEHRELDTRIQQLNWTVELQ